MKNANEALKGRPFVKKSTYAGEDISLAQYLCASGGSESDLLVAMRGAHWVMRSRYAEKYGLALEVLERWARMTKYTQVLDDGDPVDRMGWKHCLHQNSESALNLHFYWPGYRWVGGVKVYIVDLTPEQCAAIGGYVKAVRKIAGQKKPKRVECFRRSDKNVLIDGIDAEHEARP